MKVEQLFTGCLAEMAYYIESMGEAAIIDPLRETRPYIELAEKNGAKIKYIFLTHFHADFVSGQVDLANETGASIIFGPNAEAEYNFYLGKDGEEFSLGGGKITLVHTPGHSMESSSYLVSDENGNTPCICTGDCLFIGDVGRPDLAVKSDLTEEELAGQLFDSLRNKIMTLPDDIIIYPNHGAGSACGKSMSSESFDTLGNQKQTNYALRADMSKEEFIKEVLTGLKQPPLYFPNNVKMNKGINTSIEVILHRGNTALDTNTFRDLRQQDDILVIDTRSKEAFTKEGTIPGAWFIGIDGSFAPWVGTLIKEIKQKIIFIADLGREHEVVTRFSRVGYDSILGYLKGGIQAWKDAGYKVDKVNTISASEFADGISNNTITIDIRKESEFQSEHILGAINFPLEHIHSNFSEIDLKKNYFLHCASGYRSLVAASIFKANGVVQVTDISGGFKSLKKTKLEMTDYVCPTTIM